MIDLLRSWWNRPLDDGERRRLFAVAVCVIGAGVIVFSLSDAEPSSPPPPREGAATRAAPTPDLTAQPPEPAAPRAPTEEEQPPRELQGSPADVADAKRAARRFLAGYLPYTYGRRSTIASATPELRQELAGERPRVPPSERRRRPRVLLIQSDGVSKERAALLALVRDGTRRYTVRLRLAASGGRWLVTDVGA